MGPTALRLKPTAPPPSTQWAYTHLLVVLAKVKDPISHQCCYAAPALTLQHKKIDELNVCWNNVFRKIFDYRRSESVKDVIYGLCRVNFKYLLLLRTVNFFYKRLYLQSGLLHDVFWSFMILTVMSA